MSSIFRQYSWLVDLIAVLFCSFFLAKITGIYLGKTLELKISIGVLKTVEPGPAEVKRPDVSEYKIILERNIFDSTETPTEETAAGVEGAEEAVATGEAVKTSLDIKVIGILVVGEGRDNRSTATVVGPGGKAGPSVYAVGDVESFAPNTKLTKVAPDRIEFLNGGRLEYAEIGGELGPSIFGPPPVGEAVASKAPAPVEKKEGPLIKPEGAGRFTIDQKEIENALSNLDKLYTEIRAVPNFEGGKVSGMKVLSVKSGSLFSKIGLQRGDVLQRINGIELDVRKGFEIFNQLKDQKTLTVDLIRQGSQQTFEYEIR